MKTVKLSTLLLIPFAVITMFMISCDKDEDVAAPTVTLDNEILSANVGETIEITATVDAPGGFDKLVVSKLHNGTSVDNTEYTEEKSSYLFTYVIAEDDVDPILTFSFTAYDKGGKTGAREAIVDIGLTMTQTLLKYDWLLTEEIREKTGTNDIAAHYTDDIYRFHEDGTWQRSFGEKLGALDGLDSYCYWNLNEESGLLQMSRTDWVGNTTIDTLNITELSSTAFVADAIYRGLDLFDETYDPVENFVKKFAAQAKGANFDPYGVGASDDNGPIACEAVDWK